MLNAARLSIYEQTRERLPTTYEASLMATCVSILNLFASMHWSYSATSGGTLALFLTLLYGGVSCMQACALHTPRSIINNISKHLLELRTTITEPTSPATNTPEAKAEAEFCRYVVYNQMHRAFTVAKNRIGPAGALGKLLGATMGTTFSVACMVAACDSDNAWAHEILSPSSAIETLIFVSSQFFLFPRLFRIMLSETYNAIYSKLEHLEEILTSRYQNSTIPPVFEKIDPTCYWILKDVQKMNWHNI